MITHAEAQALVSERLDNSLDPYINDVLEAHLAGCAECRAFANSSDYLASSLRSMPFMPASDSVRQNVWQAIEHQNTPWNRVTSAMTGQTAAIISTAAIALIVIAFASVAILRLVDSGNGGEDPDARLAAGTQESLALATEPSETMETEVATETVAPTVTEEPETQEQAPEPTETETPPAPTTTPVPTEVSPVPTATSAPTEVPTEEPAPTTPPVEVEEPTVPLAPTPTPLPVDSAEPAESDPTDLTGDSGPSSNDADDTDADVSAAFNPANLIATAVSSDLAPLPSSTPLPSPTPAPATETMTPATETPGPPTSVPPTATPPPPVEEGSTSPPIQPIGGEDPDADEPDASSSDVSTIFDGQAADEDEAQETEIIGPAEPQGDTGPDDAEDSSDEDSEGTDAQDGVEVIDPQGQSGVGGATSPIDGDSDEGGSDGEDGQVIEPIDVDSDSKEDDDDLEPIEITEEGGTPVPDGEAQGQETPGEGITPALIDELQEQDGVDDDTSSAEDQTDPTQESGAYPLSEAPFFSNGQPWGSVNDRLGFEGDSVTFSANPDGFSLDREDIELQTVGGENGQGIAICANGECVSATTDSADGPHTDEPIGWIGDRLIYQRVDPEDGDVEIRAVEWNGAPISDEQIGTLDDAVSPLGTAYPVEAGTLIPTSSSWLLISDDGVEEVDENPYGEIGLVRTDLADDLIAYVAGGQLVIANVSSPGSAISTLPFNGVDYDLSPDGQMVVISTGSGIELYTRDGSLIGATDASIETGSVLWRSTGIVFIDLTTGTIRLLDPAVLLP